MSHQSDTLAPIPGLCGRMECREKYNEDTSQLKQQIEELVVLKEENFQLKKNFVDPQPKLKQLRATVEHYKASWNRMQAASNRILREDATEWDRWIYNQLNEVKKWKSQAEISKTLAQEQEALHIAAQDDMEWYMEVASQNGQEAKRWLKEARKWKGAKEDLARKNEASEAKIGALETELRVARVEVAKGQGTSKSIQGAVEVEKSSAVTGTNEASVLAPLTQYERKRTSECPEEVLKRPRLTTGDALSTLPQAQPVPSPGSFNERKGKQTSHTTTADEASLSLPVDLLPPTTSTMNDQDIHTLGRAPDLAIETSLSQVKLPAPVEEQESTDEESTSEFEEANITSKEKKYLRRLRDWHKKLLPPEVFAARYEGKDAKALLALLPPLTKSGPTQRPTSILRRGGGRVTVQGSSRSAVRAARQESKP
ncbi:MAG: hypothetical protein Q9227_000666 [Pyrenula ochraceoflavens]